MRQKMGKRIGLGGIFCLASGAMISSGLFILPGLAHAMAGPAVVFSYFLAGMLAATGMLSVAEIITAMPKAGGDYFYITRTLGPAAGTVAGLLSWFSLALKGSFALIGMGAFLRLVLPLDALLAGLICLFVFVLINIAGSKKAAIFQIVLVSVLLVLMTAYVIWGVGWVRIDSFAPFAPQGWDAVLATAGLVFVSYGGLLNVASVAEEVKDPGRNIHLGMALSLVVVLAFYLAMVFVTSGVLGSEILDNSMTPISDGAEVFWGKPGLFIMSVAAVLAFISTANSGVMSASRYLMALSRDELLPSFFGRLSHRFSTPYVAILITGVFMGASLFLGLEGLVKAASTVLILTNLLANICLIILRESRLLNYRPKFQAPFYPWLQLAGVAGFLVLLLEMGWQALLTCLLLVSCGLLFYWLYGRVKTVREYALIHLVERMMDRELAKGVLESELKQIVKERDQLCPDQFDDVVEKASIIDADHSLDLAGLFNLLAAEVHQSLGLDEKECLRELHEREDRGSSIMLPGVGVSDLLLAQSGVFKMVVVRCREGIDIGHGEGREHAFFLIIASLDRRNSYLQTMGALAQVAQDQFFEHRWLRARDAQALRDLLILGDRRRVCEGPFPEST